MTVKVQDIVKEMEKIAPLFLKEDYDNVGLMVGDNNIEVTRVLLALDCTHEVIEEAKLLKVQMIITHHPLLFKKPSKIVNDDLIGSKIIELIKNDISLYSSHTNLDSVKGGINEKIVKVLGFEKGEIIDPSKIQGYEDSGIGRIVTLDESIDIGDLIKKVKTSLRVNNLRAVISTRSIKKIAIVNGSGQDYFEDAKSMGADCIITGDTTYHFASDYKEMGISIIDPGHFSTEWLIFIEVMKEIEDEFKNIEFIHSKLSSDPFSFY